LTLSADSELEAECDIDDIALKGALSPELVESLDDECLRIARMPKA
jgi:hypothetical protein